LIRVQNLQDGLEAASTDEVRPNVGIVSVDGRRGPCRFVISPHHQIIVGLSSGSLLDRDDGRPFKCAAL
jgi:hypothetical protein